MSVNGSSFLKFDVDFIIDNFDDLLVLNVNFVAIIRLGPTGQFVSSKSAVLSTNFD